MTDSLSRPWSNFFRDKDASLLTKNVWAPFLLLNLATRYPWVSHSQIFDLARHFGASSDFIRPAIHALARGGLLRQLEWKSRRPDLEEPIFSADNRCWEMIHLGTGLGLSSRNAAPPGKQMATPEQVYSLPEDAPGTELIQTLRVGENLLPAMPLKGPSAPVVANPKEPKRRRPRFGKPAKPSSNTVNWLGLAEIHLRMLIDGRRQATDGFLAVSKRIAAYQEGLSLPETMEGPAELDESFALLLAESERINKETATAVTFFSLTFMDVRLDDCKQDIPEAQQWNQFEIWPHKDRVRLTNVQSSFQDTATARMLRPLYRR